MKDAKMVRSDQNFMRHQPHGRVSRTAQASLVHDFFLNDMFKIHWAGFFSPLQSPRPALGRFSIINKMCYFLQKGGMSKHQNGICRHTFFKKGSQVPFFGTLAVVGLRLVKLMICFRFQKLQSKYCPMSDLLCLLLKSPVIPGRTNSGHQALHPT